MDQTTVPIVAAAIGAGAGLAGGALSALLTAWATRLRETASREESRRVRAEDRAEQHRIEQRDLMVEILILARRWGNKADVFGPLLGKAQSDDEIWNNEIGTDFARASDDLRRALVQADLSIRSDAVRALLTEVRELLDQYGCNLGLIIERRRDDPSRSGDPLIDAVGLSVRTAGRFHRRVEELTSAAGQEFRL